MDKSGLSLRTELRKSLKTAEVISLDYVGSRGWGVVVFDDRVIFDEYASALSIACREVDVEVINVVKITDLQSDSIFEPVKVPVSPVEIESISDIDRSALALFDVLIYPDDLSFLILRTGSVLHTIYAGGSSFLRLATGVDLAREKVAMVGNHWEVKDLRDEYGSSQCPS